ncbi:MAG: hypothetical protein AAFY41_15620, partial [Bacteroidota bacterium]
ITTESKPNCEWIADNNLDELMYNQFSRVFLGYTIENNWRPTDYGSIPYREAYLGANATNRIINANHFTTGTIDLSQKMDTFYFLFPRVVQNDIRSFYDAFLSAGIDYARVELVDLFYSEPGTLIAEVGDVVNISDEQREGTAINLGESIIEYCPYECADSYERDGSFTSCPSLITAGLPCGNTFPNWVRSFLEFYEENEVDITSSGLYQGYSFPIIIKYFLPGYPNQPQSEYNATMTISN